MRIKIINIVKTLVITALAFPYITIAAAESPQIRLFTGSACPPDEALNCWLGKVFSWSQTALLVSAVGALVIAGIMYMGSAGNPQVIGKSKKIIIGALSGVAVVTLGKLFLTKFIGVTWL